MLPLVDDILLLQKIAEYWSREHDRVRTMIEIFDELLTAFWQNKLIIYGSSERNIIDRRRFLKTIRLHLKHPGFTIVQSRFEVPVRTTKHPDGSVDIDATCYIVLPSDENSWTADILKTAYERLATRSFEDFDDLVKPGLLALGTTREALGAYCESMPYPRPRFWFKGAEKAKSFGGRPSVMRRIETEMTRRAGMGLLAPKLREEARVLRSWAEQNIPASIQLPQVGAIENSLREVYRKLKLAASLDGP